MVLVRNFICFLAVRLATVLKLIPKLQFCVNTDLNQNGSFFSALDTQTRPRI